MLCSGVRGTSTRQARGLSGGSGQEGQTGVLLSLLSEEGTSDGTSTEGRSPAIAPERAKSTSQHISGHLFVQDAVSRQARSSANKSDGRSAQAINTAWEASQRSTLAEPIERDLRLDPFSLICDKARPIRSLPPVSLAAARPPAGFGQTNYPTQNSR